MPSVYGTVIICGDGEGLDLMLEEAECFYIGQVLPVGGIDIVSVGRVPLHDGDCQC